MCMKSETITKLAMALVKAQSEITSVKKDKENPHFKKNYATLDNIIEETRPILAKHGLAILQMPGGDGENVIMKTMVMHESGEWMETDALVMRPVKNDPQGVGSCITYARRYSYSALLSISTEEDDDGNGASQAPQQRQQYQPSSNTQTQQQAPTSQTGTSGEHPMGRVFALVKELGWKANDANAFASECLNKTVKFPMKDYVKTREDWEKIEQALIATKNGLAQPDPFQGEPMEPYPEDQLPF